MNITKETRVFLVQVWMNEQWVDVSIKDTAIKEVQRRLELNKNNQFLVKYKHRIIKRIETVFEEECSVI